MKRLPYKLVEIDLYGGKPSWFLELNPAGLVPVRSSPCPTLSAGKPPHWQVAHAAAPAYREMTASVVA